MLTIPPPSHPERIIGVTLLLRWTAGDSNWQISSRLRPLSSLHSRWVVIPRTIPRERFAIAQACDTSNRLTRWPEKKRQLRTTIVTDKDGKTHPTVNPRLICCMFLQLFLTLSLDLECRETWLLWNTTDGCITLIFLIHLIVLRVRSVGYKIFIVRGLILAIPTLPHMERKLPLLGSTSSQQHIRWGEFIFHILIVIYAQ